MGIISYDFKLAEKIHAVINIFINSSEPKLAGPLKQLAERVQGLIQDHGLTDAQFLAFVPPEWNWSVATIGDADQLVKALRATQIGWFAKTFNVERKWLEGQGQGEWACIPFMGYKQISVLGWELQRRGWLNPKLKMTMLAEDYFDKRFPLGRYAIVFSSPAFPASPDADSLYQHNLFEGEMPWGEWICRRDTKAVARWFSMHLNHFERIPIVPIKSRDFNRVVKLEISPAQFIPKFPVGYEGLEDRVLRPRDWIDGESMRSIESNELEDVLMYLEASGLTAYRQQDASELEIAS